MISSLFLAIHKVCLRKTAILRTQFFSKFALAESRGAALKTQNSNLKTVYAFFFRKKPPAKQMRIATPATRAEPTTPEKLVPAALSLSGKA